MRRPDGKPEVAANGDAWVSAAHAHELTLAVSGRGAVACDIEPVAARRAISVARSAGLRSMGSRPGHRARDRREHEPGRHPGLGRRRMLDQGRRAASAPLVFATATGGREILFSSGALAIATFIVPDRTGSRSLVLALLTRRDHASV